jgi:hypothetical protein
LLNASVDEEARVLVDGLSHAYETNSTGNGTLCACCFSAISYGLVDELVNRVLQTICNRSTTSNSLAIPVCLEVAVPPIMDAYRITARTVITAHADKIFPFPAVDELLTRVITQRLKDQVNIVSEAEARIKVLGKYANFDRARTNCHW